MTAQPEDIIEKLQSLRKEVEIEVLRDDWDTASRISGMLGVHRIKSVICSIDYIESGEKHTVPAVAIPVDQYTQIVKMLTQEGRSDDD